MGITTSEREKKQIAHTLFHLEEMLLSLESVWQGPLMCLSCEMTLVEREIQGVNLYRATSHAVLTKLALHFMTAAAEFIFQLSKVLKYHIEDFSLIVDWGQN